MVKCTLGMVVECLARTVIKFDIILHTFIRQTVDIIHWSAFAFKIQVWKSIDKSGFIQGAKRVTECALVRLGRNSATEDCGYVICAKTKVFGEDRERVTFSCCEAECRWERCLVGLQAFPAFLGLCSFFTS